MNLFAKGRVAFLSIAHGLLDKIIDLNSTQAVRQYVRDLEDSISELETSVAEARGGVVTIKRDRSRAETQMGALQRQIDALLTDDDESNDHLAETLEAKRMGYQTEFDGKVEDLASAEQTVKALAQVQSSLSAKHQQMVSQLARLEAMERSTKAKEGAAEAIKGAVASMGSGADASVDNVAHRLERRADVADAALVGQMGKFDQLAGADVQVASVKASLAARKAQLKAGSTTSA